MAYSAHEVATLAGVSKNTLLRWLKQGKVPEVTRDRNGWRVFGQEDADRVREFARKTTPPDVYAAGRAAQTPCAGRQPGEAA